MKCSQKSCSEIAVWAYFWPGHSEPLFGCEVCTRKALGIADAMGFDLCVLPIASLQEGPKLPAIEPKPQNPATQERQKPVRPARCVGCAQDCDLWSN
jgi:hypothetical protein